MGFCRPGRDGGHAIRLAETRLHQGIVEKGWEEVRMDVNPDRE